MKKRASFFYISIAILALTFSSCKLKVEDESLYDKPTVHISDDQIVTIIIEKVSVDTKYINLYRREKKSEQVSNIGILFHPQALVNEKNYIYDDTLVQVNHSYDYRARYKINGKYYFTDWSDTIEIKDGIKACAEDDKLTYQVGSDAKLIFKDTDYTLTIDGTIAPPTFDDFSIKNFKPVLVFQSDKLTQAFPIDSIAHNTQISLRGTLPPEFLDTQISVKGIVGQRIVLVDEKDTSEDPEKKMIIWTEPAKIKVQGAGKSETFTIPSQSGTAGMDYSDTAE